ncbi:hypothetical protein GM708_01725 [Vibrio cholerae]|nr:hypothetical protein [Vibrio cholerae]
MMGQALLLVNPKAGRGRALRLWPGTAAALGQAGFSSTVVVTESLGEATDRAAEVPRGSLVAALGG